MGYEKTIITAEIVAGQNRRKFIPIIRNVTGQEKIPAFFGGALYLDLSDSKDNDNQLMYLLKSLHQVYMSKPPLGPSPFLPAAMAEKPKQEGMENRDISSLRGQSRCAAFSGRFSMAFPGVRGVAWFNDGQTIMERLKILLKQPLTFKEGHLAGWWRGPANLHIDRFDTSKGRTF